MNQHLDALCIILYPNCYYFDFAANWYRVDYEWVYPASVGCKEQLLIKTSKILIIVRWISLIVCCHLIHKYMYM